MRKLTRKSLDELAQRMPVLSEEVQSSYVGGGTGNTIMDPLTFDQYRSMGSFFISGWVDLPDSISLLKHPYDYYFGGSGSDGNGGYWDGSGSYGPTGYWDSDLGIFVWGESGSESGNEPPNYVIDYYKRSCVFSCFDYIDGPMHEWHYYSRKFIESGGTVGNDGGVSHKDIITIANFGGFDVRWATTKTELSNMINEITTMNGTIDGNRVMMTIPTKTIDHAVIVTGRQWDVAEDGYIISYYDPLNNKSDFISPRKIRNLYVIAPKK